MSDETERIVPHHPEPILGKGAQAGYMLSDKALEELKNRFQYHAPTLDQTDRQGKIRRNAFSLARIFEESCPDSRELSLALTKLDEAVMWANAAISRNEG